MIEDQKNNHSSIYELVMQTSHELRRILEIDDCCHPIYVSSKKDPRKYYLHNVLNEVEKSTFSVMSANELLVASRNEFPAREEDERLSSKILQYRIDELSLWRRKLVEILVDLIGFRKANSLNYYQHYNCLYERELYKNKSKDQETFWGCNNQALKQQIQKIEKEAEQLSQKLDVNKCWYSKGASPIQKNLTSTKDRFIQILPQAKKFQKAILISYYNSFGKQSELMHPNRITNERLNTLNDFDHAIRAISVLALHVISGIKDLLHMHNAKGSLKLIANVIKNHALSIHLLNLRTSPKISAGDFIITAEGPFHIIKVTKRSKHKYKKIHVELLIPSGSNIITDEYTPEDVQMFILKKEMRQKVLEILQKSSPEIKVSHQKINKAIRCQVLELWTLIQTKKTKI